MPGARSFSSPAVSACFVVALLLAVDLLIPVRMAAQTVPAAAADSAPLPAQLQATLNKLDAALNVARAKGDVAAEAKTFNQIGEFYLHASNYPASFDNYSQARTAALNAKDIHENAAALNGMGDCYRVQGKSTQAAGMYQQALDLAASSSGNQDEQATALSGLGWVNSAMGQDEKALGYYSQALQLARAAKAGDLEARALRRTGLVYYELGDKQKALDYYNQALPIFRSLNDRDREATMLNDFGLVYCDMGEKPKALEYHRQALEIFRSIGDRDGEALSLSHMGQVDSDLGDFKAALDLYKQSLVLIQQVDDLDGVATALSQMGRAYSELGDGQNALDSNMRALLDANAANDPLLQAEIFHNLMRDERTSQPTVAIFYGKEAVNRLQQVKGYIQDLDNEVQRSFLASKEDYYRDLADLLIASGRQPEAQQVLDMMKEAQFEQFTRQAASPSDQTASLTSEEQAAEKDYHDASQNFFQIAAAKSLIESKQNRTDDDNKKLSDLDAQLTAANRKFSQLIQNLPGLLPQRQADQADEMARNIPRLRLLMHAIAEPGTVALYTLVTDHFYRVIIITSDQPPMEVSTPIEIGLLRTQVARFLELVSLNPDIGDMDQFGNRGRTAAETGEMMDLDGKLYNELFAPVAADLRQLNAHTLVWELDDVLHYIPLGALFDPATKKFLVQNYANVVITSKNNLSNSRPDLTGAQILAMGISKGVYGKEFAALPQVPLELSSIVHDQSKPDSRGVLPGTEWLDSDFTEARLIEELKKNASAGGSSPYKIVHIASHFNADPAGDYVKSFLLLAGKNANLDQNGQGFHLTLDELQNDDDLSLIFQGVDLLTLSACQTAVTVEAKRARGEPSVEINAMGERVEVLGAKRGEGEEIDGLGEVAQVQGADAVIASLWSVNDQSTSKLMARFYKLWTDPAKKMAKVDALSQAQRDMLGVNYTANGQSRAASDPDVAPDTPADGGSAVNSFADPYYWAPFILMGNWK
jgi:CHAT domain-containing protein/tetratricopeptide (TPR) repeat protein